jgi:hypothetical protein
MWLRVSHASHVSHALDGADVRMLLDWPRNLPNEPKTVGVHCSAWPLKSKKEGRSEGKQE